MPREAPTTITRRGTLLGAAGVLFASAAIPRVASAAGARDPRFLCVILRGALDGLAAVPPVGDPAYAALRGDLALGRDGPAPALPLDGFFALHPAMPNLARLYAAGQAAVVHAVATSYRERSHFDGQDVLESGLAGPGRAESGWLNRLASALPAGGAVDRAGVLGVGAVAPLVVRGPAPVMGWAPPVLAPATGDLAERLLDLYAREDPALARALAAGLETDRLAGGGPGLARPREAGAIRRVAEGAARLLAADGGPRVAALALDGWDTHAREGGATGRLADLLRGLDDALAALEAGLGPERWQGTVVMVATEFGRTARANGSDGTDHGTATAALLVGGAVRGGRVLADWPGLRSTDLREGRDLRPTTDLRSVAKGVLADLFGVPVTILDRAVFPGSEGVPALAGLVA